MSTVENYPNLRPSVLLDFANSGQVDPRIQCLRASTATCFGPDGKLRTVANNVPRIEFDPITGKCLALLAEEPRTNTALNSGNFAAASWSKTRSSVEAPDANGWCKLIEDTTANNTHVTACTITTAGATTYTFSADVKTGSRNLVSLVFGNFAAQVLPITIYLNMDTGAISGAIAGRYTLAKLADGWRVSITTTTVEAPGSNISAIVQMAEVAGSSSYTGDGVSHIYVRNAQIEVGAFPTSYIPTAGAAVTRAAEALTLAGFTWTNWTSGLTFLIEAETPAAWPTDTTLLALNNGTAQDNQIDIRYVATGVATRTRAGGATIASTIHTGIPLSGRARVALSVTATNFISSANGSVAYSVAAPFSPAAPLDRLAIGFRAISNSPFSGHIQRISIYPSALTAAQVQRLSA